MAHRTRGRSLGRIPDSIRRKKSWLSFGLAADPTFIIALQPATPAIGAPTVDVVAVASGDAPHLVEGTLIRMRGSILVPKSSDDTVVADVMAFGIGFVTDEAAAAAAVPNPATVLGADWDGWMFFRSNVAAPVDTTGTIMDAKSMRKWNSGMSLVLVAGAATTNGTPVATAAVQLQLRGLFLLP